MTRAYEAAGPALLQHLVVSHTDLDQKNVLWRDAQTPCLIDWESAGLINPTMELASVALYWAGITAGQPDERVVAATIEGYVRAGGVIVASGLEAIHGFMGTWLGWLLFNMRRSLGECTHDPDECELGVREATNALNVLRLLDMHAETWAGWVDAWR
jgi:thiamine kinase-like enzyme